MRSLYDFTREELAALFIELDQPAYRVQQVWDWCDKSLQADPAEMRNLPLVLRQALTERVIPRMLEVAEVAESTDGSKKFIFKATDGALLETVWMPHNDGRLSLCLSSQVGCALGCTFCATATLGLRRHLMPGELLEQVFQLHQREGRRPDNLVLMGMGEALHNRAHLGQFLTRLSDPSGYAFSLARVTLSTVGLMDELAEFHEAFGQVNLAISLVTPFDDQRSGLMPINKKYPVASIAAGIAKLDLKWGTRVTLEYPLMAGVNDRPEDAREIRRVFGGSKVKINLIPYNVTAHAAYTRPELEAIEGFQRGLQEGGIRAFVRWSKGQDVGAACGQLVAAAPRRSPEGEPEQTRAMVLLGEGGASAPP